MKYLKENPVLLSVVAVLIMALAYILIGRGEKMSLQVTNNYNHNYAEVTAQNQLRTNQSHKFREPRRKFVPTVKFKGSLKPYIISELRQKYEAVALPDVILTTTYDILDSKPISSYAAGYCCNQKIVVNVARFKGINGCIKSEREYLKKHDTVEKLLNKKYKRLQEWQQLEIGVEGYKNKIISSFFYGNKEVVPHSKNKYNLDMIYFNEFRDIKRIFAASENLNSVILFNAREELNLAIEVLSISQSGRESMEYLKNYNLPSGIKNVFEPVFKDEYGNEIKFGIGKYRMIITLYNKEGVKESHHEDVFQII